MRKIILVVLITLLSSQFAYATRIDDQGDTKMCVVYAVCNAVEEEMIRNGLEVPKDGFDKQIIMG